MGGCDGGCGGGPRFVFKLASVALICCSWFVVVVVRGCCCCCCFWRFNVKCFVSSALKSKGPLLEAAADVLLMVTEEGGLLLRFLDGKVFEEEAGAKNGKRKIMNSK